MSDQPKFGLYIEDEEGGYTLLREVTFENGTADVSDIGGRKWALGILYPGDAPYLTPPSDTPITELRQLSPPGR